MTGILTKSALVALVAGGVALASLPAAAGTWIGDDGTVIYGAPPPPMAYDTGAAYVPAPPVVSYVPPPAPIAPPAVSYAPPPPPPPAYAYPAGPLPYGGPAIAVSIGP